jgi:segregation and condensation protein B
MPTPPEERDDAVEPAEAPPEPEPTPAVGTGEVEADPDEGAGDEAAEAPPRAAKRKPREFGPVPPDRLEGAVEALLLASGDVLTVERMRDLLGLSSVIHVREALDAITARWSEAHLAVELQEVAGGIRVTTRPEYAEYVRRLSRRPDVDKLSPSLMETLSIVAYRQPAPRVEVERIRGVQCGDALRSLLERRLVKVVGRSDQPGRPLLYGTTRRFLEVFGLNSLKDLPKKGDLKRL